ncbi:hypothetical protein BpHYR1_007331, partial [Brachionus plicatilis]
RVVITVASPTKSSSPISLLAIFLGLPGPLCLFPNVFSLSAVLLVAAPLCCRLTCLSGFIINNENKSLRSTTPNEVKKPRISDSREGCFKALAEFLFQT